MADPQFEAVQLQVVVRSGQLQNASVLLRAGSGELALLELTRRGVVLRGTEPSLPLALNALAFVTDVATRLEEPAPGAVQLQVDGRLQRRLTRYGPTLKRVQEWLDRYAEGL
jgi:hypothetical protein